MCRDCNTFRPLGGRIGTGQLSFSGEASNEGRAPGTRIHMGSKHPRGHRARKIVEPVQLPGARGIARPWLIVNSAITWYTRPQEIPKVGRRII
jgi:hypothetical protein